MGVDSHMLSFSLLPHALLVLLDLILLSFLAVLLLPSRLREILLDIATCSVFIICDDCLLSVRPTIGSLGEGSMRFELSCHFKFVFLLFVALGIDCGTAIHRYFLRQDLCSQVHGFLIVKPRRRISIVQVKVFVGCSPDVSKLL